jgi:hypothetical protein
LLLNTEWYEVLYIASLELLHASGRETLFEAGDVLREKGVKGDGGNW